MNPYLKLNPNNTNPPYDDATINKFNTASSSALGYLKNRLNDPIYYKRLQNEIAQSNKLGNVMYDTKTGALDLLNQRKKGLNEVNVISPNTTNPSEISIINEIKNQDYLGAHTTGRIGRYAPEYQKEGFMQGSLMQPVAGYETNVIGINPKMFNAEYDKYLENILLHEGEHSTNTAYPDYTNPYYNVGMMDVDNGRLPLYRNVSNITPYATNVIKENILSDDEYYSNPMEVVASKRQIEHLLEKAPEGTFKKSWKYGDNIDDEHFNYFLNDKNNVESSILKKSLLGDRNLEELNEEERKNLKERFSNIMTKIAYNENNDGIYNARNGTMIKRADGSYSERGLWDNIRANKGSGNNPTKQMLEQEKKIKQQEMQSGGKTNPYLQADGGTQVPTYTWGSSTPTKVVNTTGSGHSQTMPSTYKPTGDLTKITQESPEGVGGSGWSNFEKAYDAGNTAIGKYLVQPIAELFNTPFATFAEGVNAIQGKEYDFKKALPNPTRMALNAEGIDHMIPQQQYLSDYLGVDREKNPYLSMGLDFLTPGPGMFTKPITALTGIGKASTNAIKTLPVKKTPKVLTSSSKENPGFNVTGNVIDDGLGNKINPEEVSKFIEEKGLKIIQEGIETPEGRRRLANQFKKENPNLSASEIDDLVETRIVEAKASVIHNKPKKYIEEINNPPHAFVNVEQKFEDTFPFNAYWYPYNPSYPYTPPTPKSRANIIDLSRRSNPFIAENFNPGMITLGRGYQDDIATLDHELGHATAKGGQMPIDRELVKLLKPKNIFDEGFQWLTNKIYGPQVKKDYKYFSESDRRRWNNEAYPHLRETRRSMIEKGILKDTYDKVTPLKLFKHIFSGEPSRILSFTPPWKFSALSKLFNEAPAVVPGAIGTGAAAAIIRGGMSNQEVPQQRYGGQNPYITQKYKYGGPVDPIDPETQEQVKKTKEYLLSMANSPLLLERYAASKGKEIKDVSEEELAEYKHKIIDNTNTASIGDYNSLKRKDLKGTKNAGGWYVPPITREKKELIEMEKIGMSEKDINKYFKYINDYEKNQAHKVFIKNNAFVPAYINHEFSHASTRANEDLDYKGKPFSYSQERLKLYENEDMKWVLDRYMNNIDYYTDPTEQKARVDVVRQWMKENNLYDATKDRFDENHLNILRDKYNDDDGNLDEYTKDQLQNLLFPYDKNEIIRMFNTFTKVENNENNPYRNYARLGTKVDPVDPEEEKRMMQERLMRYIRGNGNDNRSIFNVNAPNEYGLSFGDRFNIQSGLSFDPMSGMPAGYGQLGINTNGFNLGVKKKKGIGVNENTFNLGYNSPNFNVDASYSNENQMPSFRGNIGYNNNGVNVGIGGNYSPNNKSISANIGYNKNGINAGLNYDYSGQHSMSGNVGYGNDMYNVGISGEIMPGQSNIGLNATYNLGKRKQQIQKEIALAFNKPIEVNLIKEENEDIDAEQAAGPPEMNYGGYVNPDDPTLPSPPMNLFSNYDMEYKNPFADDTESAMTGMMKARIATDAEFGNAAAKRLTSPFVNPYMFTGNEKIYGEEVGVPAGATGTHFMSSMGQYAVPFIQQKKDGSLYFNENASPSDLESMKFETESDAEYFSNENYKKVAPLMTNWGKYKKGGESDLVPVEVERSERIYDPEGNLLKEIPADAPTHEEGGVKLHLRPGTLVFPKKYYKALDAASGLPEFNKIKEKMLDNAEKAYLRGEPYSSGGKRD